MTTTYPQTAFNPVFANTNSVVALGCVARDPEMGEGQTLRYVITVAGEEIITGDDGKDRRVPFYEQAIYYGKQAEKVLALGLKKGEAVVLDGKFTQRKMVDPVTNAEKTLLEIKYGTVRRALGFGKAERSSDAAGNTRLVGGFVKATVYGRVIGKGAELRYTQSGLAVLNFSINARSSWKDASGEWQSDAAFIRVQVWRESALELAAMEISKGMEALIEGRPNRGSFVHKETGKKTYTLDLAPTRVVITEGLDAGGGYAARGPSIDDLPSFDDGLSDFNDDGALPF